LPQLLPPIPAPPTPASLPQQPLPWTDGQTVAGWTVVDTQRSADHVVVHLSSGPTRAGVEVVLRGAAEDEWTVGPYRVQPAPGAPVVEPAVVAWREWLRQLPAGQAEFLVRPVVVQVAEPAAREAAPFVSQPARQTEFSLEPVDSPQPDWQARLPQTLLIGANALVVALFLALLWRWLRRQRQAMRIVAPALLVALAGVAALHLFLPPDRLPVALLTVLHEGGSEQNIQHLYGNGVHAGPAWKWLAAIVGPPGLKLRHVVHLNLQFWWLQTVFLAAMTAWLTRSVPRVLATVGLFALTLAPAYGAIAEVPSMLLAIYFCAGVMAGAVLQAERPGWTPWRLAALLQWLVLTVLTALTRPEMALLIAPVLIFEILQTAAPARMMRWLVRLEAAFWRVLALPPRLLAGLALLLILAWFLLDPLLPPQFRWLVAGLQPLNPATLTQPLVLASLAPVAAGILYVAGVWQLARGQGHQRLVLLAVIFLFRMYFSASHQVYYELVRYMTLLAAPVAWCAAHGWSAWDGWLGRLSLRSQQALQLGLVVACLAWVPHGQIQHFADVASIERATGEDRRLGLPQVLLQQDVQREVRFLQSAVEAYPDCVVLARTVLRSPSKTSEPEKILAFGRPLAAVGTHAAGPWTPQRLRVEALASWRCVLYYRSLSCNLVDGDTCAHDTDGAKLLRQDVFAAKPYNDAYEWGESAPIVRLGLYRLADAPGAL
jgi:hypothetical protein